MFIAGKEIWGIVPEDRRAWTSGSVADDGRALTFEALNLLASPSWAFAQDTLDSIARIQADWMTRYGIPLSHSQPGAMEYRNVYEWFGRGYPTACAGPSYDITQRIADTQSALTPTPVPDPTIGEIMAFKSIAICYRPDEEERDRLLATALDFEDGTRTTEYAMGKEYAESYFGKLTEGGAVILSGKKHYESVLADFDTAVKQKREHELAVARASAGE